MYDILNKHNLFDMLQILLEENIITTRRWEKNGVSCGDTYVLDSSIILQNMVS